MIALPIRYWWVNQGQTWRQEQRGGYLWAPVHQATGHRSRFYDNMREVAPGDLIFCFYEGRVCDLGIALSYCFDAPKPSEFGDIGSYWEQAGHRVTAQFVPCPVPVRPKDHMTLLRPLLPAKYSPLQPQTGNGLQGVYLASISPDLASTLLSLVHLDEQELVLRRAKLLALSTDYDGASVTSVIEDAMVREVTSNLELDETTRRSVIEARRGQGQFRRAVLDLELRCRLTHISDPAHLLASHIKPWRACDTAKERLDGNNGLALAPHIDHLFDKGFISFADQGSLLVSPLVHESIWSAFHIDPSHSVGHFREGQAEYLKYHREHKLRRIG